MKIDIDNYRTPGQLIEALLAEKGWTKRVLALVLDIDETGINHRLSDKRPINAEFAISLEEVFGVPADSFLELQKRYDLAKERIKTQPDQKRKTRAQLFGGLPVTEMMSRGWLQADSIKDVAAIETGLTKFFNVKSADEIGPLPHAAKKTDMSKDLSLLQLAWLYRVKKIAEESLVPRYTHDHGLSAVKKLSSLLLSAEEIRKVPRVLEECGIRFVIVEALKSSKIDGVCFWLDENSPVIGMSLRFDRIDNFWFVLRHELEHVIQQHGRESREIIIDSDLQSESVDTESAIVAEEKIANEAASDFCVPTKKMESFIARKSPFFKEIDILGFAKTINVHPGLVAGQIRNHTKKYNLYSNHLVKIRSIIIPSAAVDGWGNVYPVED